MRKLLSANFSRLFRDKTFWFCMGAMLIYAVVYMLNGVRQATVSLAEYHHTLDDYYFHFALVIGMFCALFCSMFLGTEYSDGAIRNKLVVGHTRAGIYLSGLVVTFAATLFVMAVWLMGALVGVPGVADGCPSFAGVPADSCFVCSSFFLHFYFYQYDVC